MSDDNFGPWIDWAGGPCPIPDAKAGDFEIKLRNGKTIGWGSAEYWATWQDWWQWQGPKPKAIVAYRVRLPADDLLRQAIEALREFAKQRRTTEMDEDENEHADFEGAYDAFIDKARAVLTAYDKRNA